MTQREKDISRAPLRRVADWYQEYDAKGKPSGHLIVLECGHTCHGGIVHEEQKRRCLECLKEKEER